MKYFMFFVDGVFTFVQTCELYNSIRLIQLSIINVKGVSTLIYNSIRWINKVHLYNHVGCIIQ